MPAAADLEAEIAGRRRAGAGDLLDAKLAHAMQADGAHRPHRPSARRRGSDTARAWPSKPS